MKYYVFLLLSGLIFLSFIVTSQDQVPYSATEILEKSVRFHDPYGKWNTYSGKLKMNVCFTASGNTYGTEIVEIDVARDFYQWTRLVNGYKVVKGMKDGKIFYSVNGKTNPTVEEMKVFGINESGIKLMKEHHYWHFGKFTYLRNSGVELHQNVERVDFFGRKCYQLTFRGDSLKVKHPYLTGKNSFLIDCESFAYAGWKYFNGYLKAEGTIDINGIKIPAVETGYSNQSNELQTVVLFSGGDDVNNLPEKFRSTSMATAGNIGYISTSLLKADDEEALKKLGAVLKEVNEMLAKIGYPECGYVVYKILPGYKSDYTHVQEGWWTSKEVYDFIHNHPDFLAIFTKNEEFLKSVYANSNYFRMEKMFPKP